MTDQERDYSAEMDAKIAEATSGDGWIVGIVAAKLHAQLLESDHDLLDGWLSEHAVPILSDYIGQRERSIRARSRLRAKPRQFAAAASDADQSGDYSDLPGMFAATYPVDADDLRKRVADMTGADHKYVAETVYQPLAEKNKLLAAFHRAVAKKVGNRKTAEVYSEAEYEQMFRSIVGKAA